MKLSSFPKILLFGIIFHSNVFAQTNAAKSQWVYLNAANKLEYKTTERGDKIMDFSYAGYMGGGVAIPAVPAKIVVSPSEGDNTSMIQQAIDQVSSKALVNGVRGAVLLKPGMYNCERPITISASGVVLQGSGCGENGSIINMTGTPHACIVVKGNVTIKATNTTTTIANQYVPSGSISFQLRNAKGFAPGDIIRIARPVTDAWVQLMGMDKLVRDGKKQTWVTGDITTERVITKINKNTVMVDFPLTDSYDMNYLGTDGVSVTKITTSGSLSQTGVEHLRIIAPAQSVTINEGHHRALTMSGVRDSWVRNLEIMNTVNSISITANRVTVDHVNIGHEVPTKGAAKPADLNGSGAQLLFDQCQITGDNLFFFATGPKVSGPVVLLNCVFKGNGWIQPHQRWATGLLVDGCQVPGGGIDFMNRGAMGSGHGWAIGWAVAWNCTARSYLNQLPPGSANWVIGCKGESQKKAIPFDAGPLLPEGIYDAHNTPVDPGSLYLAQLAERLGKKAVQQIGY
ncbi:hypothetical protein A3860_09575 [Niastella vici]|uniref:Pectate lyase superfamily protein domain-containing protein n=1 Tax=Niastella vici TaxID=1703345 RepID=A0A1V9FEP1_9BACT|nr:hypothetical protein [Niastella vici]OQP56824.1 hypothetical protein A3860_09575 [Niastella vici]